MRLSRTSILFGVLLSLAAFAVMAQAPTSLAIKSVGSVQKKGGPMQVTVVFSDPVDPTMAAETTRYLLSGGATVTTATPMTGLPGVNATGNGEAPPTGRVVDNQCVVLEVTGLGTGQTTLTVTGMSSLDGSKTLTQSSKAFTPSGYSWVEVTKTYTSPSPGHREGRVIAVSDQGFDIYNNGRSGWAGDDEFTFVYKPMVGDFDFKTRIEFQDSAGRTAHAGIMVRERLDDTTAEGCLGRYLTAAGNPLKAWSDTAAGTMAGNAKFESNYRDTDYASQSPGCGDGSHPTFTTDTAGSSGGTPSYPSAWVRLQRNGDTLTAFYGDNGTDWSPGWSHTFSSTMPDTLYLGQAHCADWGNINAANGTLARRRFYLAQLRFGGPTIPVVKRAVGTPVGFVAVIQDGLSQFNQSTLQLTFNGAAVSATSVNGPDNAGLTTLAYTASTPLPNGSTNTVKIQFQDTSTPPVTVSKTFSFVAKYRSIPEDYATTQFSGTKGSMQVSAHQMPFGMNRGPGDDNATANAETELQDGFIDPATGQIAVSVVDTAWSAVDVVNFTQAPTDAGYFNSVNTPNYPDGSMPGGVSGTEYALQFVGYADLKAGAYHMAVNSDDGFKLSAGPNGPDVLGVVLGELNGGRGMALNSDPVEGGFDFVVSKEGVYPFRLAFWQGAGDASVEWYSQDYATGQRYPINASVTGAIKTYPNGRGRAYLKQFLPYPGKDNVIETPTIQAQLVDDLTSVVAGSIQLSLDGQPLSGVAVSKTAGTTTVTWTAPSAFVLGSRHTGQLVYAESNGKSRTNDLDFTIRSVQAGDLPADSFWIEIEDFDFDKGKSLDTASQMPYPGGQYADLLGSGYNGAVHGVDYHRPDRGPLNGAALGGYVYRTASRVGSPNRPSRITSFPWAPSPVVWAANARATRPSRSR